MVSHWNIKLEIKLMRESNRSDSHIAVSVGLTQFQAQNNLLNITIKL